MFRRLLVGCVALSLASLASCGEKDAVDDADAVPEACADIAVERFKELIIVDESVVNDPRGSNAAAGPWSFRYAIESLTPAGTEPYELVERWLESYLVNQKVNLFTVDRRARVNERFLCPWLKRTPTNECDATCGACKERKLDLALSPFRFMGVANRIDLRETLYPDGAGEGRLLFAMTDGPADDPASQPMMGSIILEYALPVQHGETAQSWAERWHALGRHADFGDAYKAELEALTQEFVKRGSWPGEPGDSAIRQLRTNEREFEWQWDQREYKLGPAGFVASPTDNTPDATVSASAGLTDWVRANRDVVLRGAHRLPANFTGGQSQPLVPVRPVGLEENLRHAFAKETCAGCHQLEVPIIDLNFQVSPFRKGTSGSRSSERP